MRYSLFQNCLSNSNIHNFLANNTEATNSRRAASRSRSPEKAKVNEFNLDSLEEIKSKNAQGQNQNDEANRQPNPGSAGNNKEKADNVEVFNLDSLE